MKKTITLFTAFYMLLSFANAQIDSFGGKIVPIIGWSSVQSTDTVDFSNEGIKLGIGIGPAVKIKVGNNFNTEVGLLFSWQGNKFSQKIDTVLNYKYNIKRQYLQIPISFNGNFKVTRYVRAVMSFGGTPAIKLSSLVDISDIRNNNISIKENYGFPGTLFNFFLVAGVGSSIEIYKGVHFVTLLKYNHAVIDSWFDGEDNLYIKKLKEKNHFISADIGLHIDF